MNELDEDERKKIYQRATCIEKSCGKQFGITVGEMEFFTGKIDRQTGQPLQLPKRCPECRAKRKAQYGK